jgi:hypothetical protein
LSGIQAGDHIILPIADLMDNLRGDRSGPRAEP